MLNLPCVIINYKTYRESSGDAAVKLSKLIPKKPNIYVCPQTIDLCRFKRLGLNILAQHVDYQSFGSHTGHVIPEVIKSYGVTGSLVNHSEKRMPLWQISETVKRLKALRLVSVVCVENLDELKKVKALKPDAIAVEPPELIGGDVSVSTAEPELVSDAVKISGNIPLLVGAGIKTGDDVRAAIELGSEGVLVASGVVKNKQPGRVVREFIKNLK